VGTRTGMGALEKRTFLLPPGFWTMTPLQSNQ